MDHGTISFRQIVGKIFRAAAVLGRAQLRHAQQLRAQQKRVGAQQQFRQAGFPPYPAPGGTLRRYGQHSGGGAGRAGHRAGGRSGAGRLEPGARLAVRGVRHPDLLCGAAAIVCGLSDGFGLSGGQVPGQDAAAGAGVQQRAGGVLQLYGWGLQLCAGGADAVCLGPDPVLGRRRVRRRHRRKPGGAVRPPSRQLCDDPVVYHRADGLFCRHAKGCGAVYRLPVRPPEGSPRQSRGRRDRVRYPAVCRWPGGGTHREPDRRFARHAARRPAPSPGF